MGPSMTAKDDILREFREFNRYTGDGKPNPPTGAPLPVGDPQSGIYNPKKAALRAALGGLAQDLLNGIALVNGMLPAIAEARDAALGDIAEDRAEAVAAIEAARTGAVSEVGQLVDQAEAARDLAAGYVNDIVFEKEVPIFGTAVGLASVDLPEGMTEIEVTGYSAPGAGRANYSEVSEADFDAIPSRLRILTQNGMRLGHNGYELWAEQAGFVNGGGDPAENAAAVQACIDYLYEKGGGTVRLRSGRTKMGPIIMRNRVFLQGNGRTNTYLELADGANADFIKSSAFDEFADGVRRGYTYYASTAARNAANRPVGSYAMVSSALDNFKDAQWYVAVSGPASSDADWDACGPVIGMVGGGVKGLSILGNRQSQTGSYWGLGLYGVGVIIDDVEVRSASKAARFEAPGALLGSFGFTVQWSVSRFNCREFDKEGFYNNMQSDGVVTDVMVAGSEWVAIDYMLKFGNKATGQKWIGGHLWGGSNGDPGIIMEGGGNTLVDFEIERPIYITATAGGTSIIGGKIYRINGLSAEPIAAIHIAAAVNSCFIQTRISHYRYCLKFEGSVGIAQKFDINFYSEDGAADYFDPGGTNLESALALSRNWFEIRPSFSGLRALTYIPSQTTGVSRQRELAVVAGAGVINPDLNSYQVYRCLGMTANMTVNNPVNGKASDRLTLNFGQDGAGGRTVTWGSSFRGAPVSSGGVFQYRTYEFIFNGTFWVYSGGTGAWV